MPNQRSRSSRRYVLALCTFLVPLTALAWLGQSELRRQAGQAQAAIAREGLEFVGSAARALETQLDRQVTEIAKDSLDIRDGSGQPLAVTASPVRAARALRERTGGYATLLDIVLLDDSGALLWPRTPPDQGLPFARDPRARDDRVPSEVLQAAELLITRGEFTAAATMLQNLLEMLLVAQPPERDGASDVDPDEVMVRFKLGAVRRRLGDSEAAGEHFRRVVELAAFGSGSAPRFRGEEILQCGLLAELAMAEIADNPALRLQLLTQIADGRRDAFHDRLLAPVAQRLFDGIPEDASCHGEAQAALRDERARQRVRAFATEFNRLHRERIRHRLQQPREPGAPIWRVLTIGTVTSILVLRPATTAETESIRAQMPPRPGSEDRAVLVGMRFDLGAMLSGTLEAFFRADASFQLAITDPDGSPVVAPPTSIPPDFTAPIASSYDLTLAAYLADADNFVGNAEAAARNMMLLVAALFATALVGALWLWRSVAREAELASLKVDLVSRVSHELKTPLALIRLYGETIRRGRTKDAAQAAGFGAIIERESDRLTTLIQRILDFSRQQAGTLQYTREPNDAAAIAARVVDTYRPHLEAKGVSLRVDSEPTATLIVDAAALEAVLVNLLENAAKYLGDDATDRTIELGVATTGDEVQIEVRDRGRGIPDGEHERIFESFYRASNAGEVRGAGLGLSLVRHFTHSHGGSIRALSRPGGGAIFQLRLPRRPIGRANATTDSPT